MTHDDENQLCQNRNEMLDFKINKNCKIVKISPNLIQLIKKCYCIFDQIKVVLLIRIKKLLSKTNKKKMSMTILD